MLKPRCRRIAAALLLAAYAVAATGLPLRGPQPPRAAGERFPCEECGCGCRSAAVCWSNCCCHTLAERIAWADREDVRPPEHVLNQAQCAGLDVRRWLPDVDGAVLAALPSLADQPQAAPAKKCCCCQKTPAAEPEPETPADDSRGWRSLACHGVLSLWVSLSVALPPAPDVEDPSPPARPTDAPPAPLFCGLSEPPATPPPEGPDPRV